MKKLYKLSTGKIYRVSEEKESGFLEKHPNAEFVRVDVEEGAAKTTSSVGSATTGQQNTAPIIMTSANTDSSQGDGSSDSRFTAFSPDRTVYTGDERKDTWIHTTLQNHPDKWVYDEMSQSLKSRTSVVGDVKAWEAKDAVLPVYDNMNLLLNDDLQEGLDKAGYYDVTRAFFSVTGQSDVVDVIDQAKLLGEQTLDAPGFLRPGWMDIATRIEGDEYTTGLGEHYKTGMWDYRPMPGDAIEKGLDIGSNHLFKRSEDFQYNASLFAENFEQTYNKYKDDIEFKSSTITPYGTAKNPNDDPYQGMGYTLKNEGDKFGTVVNIQQVVESAYKEIVGGDQLINFGGESFATDLASINELEAAMDDNEEFVDPNSGITYIKAPNRGIVNKSVFDSGFSIETPVLTRTEDGGYNVESRDDVLRTVKSETTDEIYNEVVGEAAFWENLKPYQEVKREQVGVDSLGKPIMRDRVHLMIGGTDYYDDPQRYMELRFLWNVHKHATDIKGSTLWSKYDDMSDVEIIQDYYAPKAGNAVARTIIDEEDDAVGYLSGEEDVRTNENFFSATDYENEHADGIMEAFELKVAEETSQMILTSQNQAQILQEQIGEQFHEEAIAAFSTEIEEYKTSFAPIQERIVAEMQALLPEDAGEMALAAFNEEVQKAVQAAWDEHLKPVQDKISKYVGNKIAETQEWKDFETEQNELFTNKQQEVWDTYKDSFKYDYDRWDVSELENIGNYLEDTYGFNQLAEPDKYKILNNVWKDYERRGNISSPEDLDDYRNEFWHYFYDQLSTDSDSPSGKSWFYLKSIAEEVLIETNSVMDENGRIIDYDFFLDEFQDMTAEAVEQQMEKLGRRLTAKETEDIVGVVRKRYDYNINYTLLQTRQWAEDVIESPENAYQAGGFWSGFTSHRGHQYVPVISGVVDLAQNWKVKAILDKPPHERTKAENNLLALSSVRSQTDQMVSDISVAYNAGSMFAQSVPFIGEFILTGSAFTGAKTAAKVALKKGISKSINKKIKQELAEQGLKATGRVTGVSKTTGDLLLRGNTLSRGWQVADKATDGLAFLAGTAAQTFAQPHRIANAVIEQMTDEHMFAFTTDADDLLGQLRLDTIQAGTAEGEEIGLEEGRGLFGALAVGYGVTWAEIFTEQIGAYLPGLGKGFLNKVKLKKGPLGDLMYNADLWERIALGRLMRRYGFTRSEQVINWSKNAAGWNGFASEFMEEMINMPLVNLITGNDNRFEGILTYNQDGNVTGIDTRNLKTIGLSVGAGAGVFQGGGAVISKVRGHLPAVYFVNNKRFSDAKAAERYLRTMKAKGLLNENLDIEVRNDFVAYDRFASYLEKNGLSTDIIKRQEAKTVGDQITATEVEIMEQLTEEQRAEVSEKDVQIEALEQKKSEVKESNLPTNEKAKQVRAIQKEIAALTNAKNGITGAAAKIVERKKTSELYQQTIAEVEKINNDLRKKGKKNAKITRAKTKERARKVAAGRIRQQQFGVYEKDGKYFDAKTGTEVYLTLDQEAQIDKMINEAENSHGYIVPGGEGGKAEIIINEDYSLDRRGGNVAKHEFLHFFLNEMLEGSAELKLAFGSVFKSHLQNIDPKLVRNSEFRKRLASYNNMSAAAQAEEAMALYLDAMVNGELQFNESMLVKVGDMIRHLMHRMGVKMEFNTGKDVLNFLKDFNVNVKKGEFSESMIKALEGEITIGGAIEAQQENISKIVDKEKNKLRKKLSAMEDTVTGEEPIMSEETFEKLLDFMSSKGILFSKDATNEINELGNMGWDQESWQSQGANYALETMITEQMLDGLIAAKLKFKDEKSSAEIETFIADVYAKLSTHVKNFNKGLWGTPQQNDSLYGWVNSQLANKANEVWNEAQKPTQEKWAADIEATTSEGAPLFQIAAEEDSAMARLDEITLNEEQKVIYSQFRQDLGLNEDMMNVVRDVVVQTFGRRLPKIGTKEFKGALEEAYRNELKTPIQNMMGKGASYDMFLEEYMETVYTQLSKETLLQMERRIPEELRIFTRNRRITKPTEVDALIEQGLLPKDTNRLSGPNLIEKLPYPGTEKIMAFFRGKNMQEVLGYKKGASTLGTRKDGLAKYIGQELAFDATSEVLGREQVRDRFLEIVEMGGQDIVGNEIAIILKQIDRQPGIMFSKANEADMRRLADDVNVHGYDHVFPDGQLSPEYSNIHEDSWRLIERVFRGNDLTEDGTRFKTSVKRNEDIDKSIREAFNSQGNLRINLAALQNLHRDAAIIAKELGPEFMEVVGYDVLGYVYRVMDSAAEKRDGSKGVFHDALNETKTKVQGLSSKNISNDVRIMNKGATLFKKVIRILESDQTRGAKLEQIEGLQEEIDAANTANIEAAVTISKSIVSLARSGKISMVSAINFLQIQTGIVNGLRGLSKLDLIEVRDGSQSHKLGKDHPLYKEAFNFYKKKGKGKGKKFRELTNEEAEKKALESLGWKGEHLAPNSNTMLELVSLMSQKDAVTDEQVENIFKDHSQALVTKYLADVMDDVGGANNTTNFERIKFLDPSHQDVISGSGGRSYNDFMIDRAVEGIMFSKSVDKSSAAKLKSQQNARLTYNESTESRGMSTFDFDETLIIEGENFITATHPTTGEVTKISSGNWPLEGPKMAAQGYQFDFSDFVNVRGGVEGPLLQKMRNQIEKYGADNVFVLTARQQESATAIYEWLKTQGINLPFENITGLGKSEGSAKAEWMLGKYAEGYNDMYFVDDALPNVTAVKKVLEALDIKSKVVQARIMFSKDASGEFNEMLERNKDVDAKKTFSAAEARRRGATKGRFEFFIPPSAEDFKGLMYKVLGRGKQGEQDLAWIEENLINPYARGIRDHNAMKQKMASEFRALRKKGVGLKKKVPGTNFSVEQAIRVYLFNKAGYQIPGLAKSTQVKLINHVSGNSDLINYAGALSKVTRTAEGYMEPTEFWDLGTIASDMRSLVDVTNREGFLAEWKANRDAIFSEENVNKLEAIFGTNYRDALENMLYRMETGSNRTTGAKDKVVNSFLDWINGSVGTVMFFNTRSAVLQTISTVNFIDFEDNNIFKASAAFANAPQFWKDFSYIFNSDTLKQRRSGLQMDVNAEELTDAFNTGKGPKAVIQYLLQIGFTPTQLADSFAISLGGASFYRNKVNANIKRGMSQQEAEAAAWLSFQEKSEETQQSSRPDFISQQQAGVLGRLVLAWQNTPMQMTRLMKKATLDLINGRGDVKSNVSKIMYYGVIQNIIFGALQSGLMFAMFGDDDDEIKKKEARVANGVLDTLLRGTGVYGAAVSTIKNVLLKWQEERGKGYGRQDFSKISQEIINLSPPMGSKHRKILGSVKGYEYNDEVISEMDYGIDNPMWNIGGNVVEGITNIPLGRLTNKANNIDEAINGNMETWQRAALLLGWNKWDVGVKDGDVEAAKEVVKEKKEIVAEEKREQKKIEKEAERQAENEAVIEGHVEEQEQQREDGVDEKEIKCAAVKRNGERCGKTVLSGQTYCTVHEEVDQRADGEKKQCSHVKANGDKCKMQTSNKSGKCYYHD